jgi:hypothetical protein
MHQTACGKGDERRLNYHQVFSKLTGDTLFYGHNLRSHFQNDYLMHLHPPADSIVMNRCLHRETSQCFTFSTLSTARGANKKSLSPRPRHLTLFCDPPCGEKHDEKLQ